MSKFLKIFFIGCISEMMLGVFAPSGVVAQTNWTEVGNILQQLPAQHAGALRFHDGVAWTGAYSLYYSMDTGISWNSCTSYPGAVGITDIAIFDRNHILLSTDNYSPFGSTNGQGVYLTTDGGHSWNNILFGSDGNFSQVAFDGSSSVIHASGSTDGMLYTSFDGGKNWVSSPNGFQQGGALSFAIAKDGTIFLFQSQGWFVTSSDHGKTWGGNSQSTNTDCETLSADSCDASRLYLINENIIQKIGNRSNIFLTTDAGQSWQNMTTDPLPFYSGSLASTADVLYVGTYYKGGTGIERSTDYGATWKNINGPLEQFDTRTIATVNDNIVLVLDENGNVWRTLNSGGFPLTPTFSVAPMALFQTDTISCDSVERTVQISTPNCSSISSIAFLGDTVSYRLASTGADSASVIFASQVEGAHQGKMVIMLSNGAADTIDLGGTVSPSSTALSVVSANVHTDTLGGTVSVPIAINGLPHAENIDLMLHYQGSVQYLGSFSKTGTKLDVPGPILYGRSVLQINGATSGVTLGYAMFNVFNDSNAVSFATFDSMTVLTAISTCEYSLGTPVIDTITPLFGCGITMLSQWIHLEQTPLFSIIPNPATNGQVWMTASDDLGAATVAIYDILGAERAEWQASIEKNVPIECALPEASGIYTIVVHSASGTQSLRMVRE